MLKVFKFGGASINDVQSIKHIAQLLKAYQDCQLVIVFSAMGKVTNMLEDIVGAYILNKGNPYEYLQKVKNFHNIILKNLFREGSPIFDEVNNLYIEIEWVIEEDPHQSYSYYYDQIVSIGELLSTKIMSAYLSDNGFDNKWIDVRDMIRTDNNYRNARVNWDITSSLVKRYVTHNCSITQGFIGCSSDNFTTTLGREGSDFSAAIISSCLEVEELVIWKDVPGMMNADPKIFCNAKLFDSVSFDEAIELAFYGAKVIHPRTIQPLKKKRIPLRVKSFVNPDNKGTLIAEGIDTFPKMPSYIIKDQQILLSISDKNLSFIVEDHMSKIFSLLSLHSASVNMMQNSAVSFSICIDYDKYKTDSLVKDLQKEFSITYNKNLSLYTIRHYREEDLEELLSNKKIILEQKSRNTIQVIA